MTTWDIERFEPLLNQWVMAFGGATNEQDILSLYSLCLEKDKKRNID